jgi:hypothetical protein
MDEPLVLIEILSPTNVSKTRANIRAYRTIAKLADIVVPRSTAIAAEILRRRADGTWPEQPEIVDADGELRLDSIGFAAPLRAVYRTSGLVQSLGFSPVSLDRLVPPVSLRRIGIQGASAHARYSHPRRHHR